MVHLLKRTAIALGIILISLTFISSSTAQAQPNIGVKGGVGFANMNGVDYEMDSRTGLAIGAYTNLALSNSPIVIQPELLYTQKGYAGTGTISIGGAQVANADFTFKFDYIEVPVLGKASFDAGGSSVLPYAFAGPYLGFNVNAEADIETNNGSGTEDVSDQVSSTDLGLVIGAGATVSNSINISARYEAGLTETIDGTDAKNGALMFTAGYSF